MGQAMGRAPVLPIFVAWRLYKPDQIARAFRKYLDRGRAPVLDRRDFADVCSTGQKLSDDDRDALFAAFDTDDRGQVGLMDVLGAIAMICDAPIDDRVKFGFTMMRTFTRTDQFNQSEMVMLLSACLRGYCRIKAIHRVTMSRIEQCVAAIFKLAEVSLAAGSGVEGASVTSEGGVTERDLVLWVKQDLDAMSCLDKMDGKNYVEGLFKRQHELLANLVDVEGQIEAYEDTRAAHAARQEALVSNAAATETDDNDEGGETAGAADSAKSAGVDGTPPRLTGAPAPLMKDLPVEMQQVFRSRERRIHELGVLLDYIDSGKMASAEVLTALAYWVPASDEHASGDADAPWDLAGRAHSAASNVSNDRNGEDRGRSEADSGNEAKNDASHAATDSDTLNAVACKAFEAFRVDTVEVDHDYGITPGLHDAARAGGSGEGSGGGGETGASSADAEALRAWSQRLHDMQHLRIHAHDFQAVAHRCGVLLTDTEAEEALESLRPLLTPIADVPSEMHGSDSEDSGDYDDSDRPYDTDADESVLDSTHEQDITFDGEFSIHLGLRHFREWLRREREHRASEGGDEDPTEDDPTNDSMDNTPVPPIGPPPESAFVSDPKQRRASTPAWLRSNLRGDELSTEQTFSDRKSKQLEFHYGGRTAQSAVSAHLGGSQGSNGEEIAWERRLWHAVVAFRSYAKYMQVAASRAAPAAEGRARLRAYIETVMTPPEVNIDWDTAEHASKDGGEGSKAAAVAAMERATIVAVSVGEHLGAFIGEKYGGFPGRAMGAAAGKTAAGDATAAKSAKVGSYAGKNMGAERGTVIGTRIGAHYGRTLGAEASISAAKHVASAKGGTPDVSTYDFCIDVGVSAHDDDNNGVAQERLSATFEMENDLFPPVTPNSAATGRPGSAGGTASAAGGVAQDGSNSDRVDRDRDRDERERGDEGPFVSFDLSLKKGSDSFRVDDFCIALEALLLRDEFVTILNPCLTNLTVRAVHAFGADCIRISAELTDDWDLAVWASEALGINILEAVRGAHFTVALSQNIETILAAAAPFFRHALHLWRAVAEGDDAVGGNTGTRGGTGGEEKGSGPARKDTRGRGDTAAAAAPAGGSVHVEPSPMAMNCLRFMFEMADVDNDDALAFAQMNRLQLLLGNPPWPSHSAFVEAMSEECFEMDYKERLTFDGFVDLYRQGADDLATDIAKLALGSLAHVLTGRVQGTCELASFAWREWDQELDPGLYNSTAEKFMSFAGRFTKHMSCHWSFSDLVDALSLGMWASPTANSEEGSDPPSVYSECVQMQSRPAESLWQPGAFVHLVNDLRDTVREEMLRMGAELRLHSAKQKHLRELKLEVLKSVRAIKECTEEVSQAERDYSAKVKRQRADANVSNEEIDVLRRAKNSSRGRLQREQQTHGHATDALDAYEGAHDVTGLLNPARAARHNERMAKYRQFMDIFKGAKRYLRGIGGVRIGSEGWSVRVTFGGLDVFNHVLS